MFQIYTNNFDVFINYEYKENKPTSNSTLLEGERRKRKEKNLYAKIIKRQLRLQNNLSQKN